MKTRTSYFAALFLGTIALLASCKPEPNENCNYGFKNARIINSGPVEVDGCGWLLVIDSVTYHPVNLDVDYQIAEMEVMVKYVNDPEEFRCGRGGQPFQSIRITEIRKSGADVGILRENEWDKYKMDGFRLDSAFIDHDWLMMKVSYSGGCREHDFKLWKLPPNALNPPPVELALSHDANEDMCEAWITRWVAFSLIPIRERGKHEVKFLLRGSPEMSAYFGTYNYVY